MLAAQLPTLQQPSPTTPAEGTSAPAELVQAAEAAKAQQATKERIAPLTREAECSSGSRASVLDELRRLDVERDLQRAREVQARQALAVLEADLATLTSRQARLQSTLDGERPAVAARLRRLQRLGRVGYARIAWNATSARDVGRAARLMNYLAKDDGRRLAGVRANGGRTRRHRDPADPAPRRGPGARDRGARPARGGRGRLRREAGVAGVARERIRSARALARPSSWPRGRGSTRR